MIGVCSTSSQRTPKFKLNHFTEIFIHCGNIAQQSLFQKYPRLAPVVHPARACLDKALVVGKGLAPSQENFIDEEIKDILFLLGISEDPNLAHSNNPRYIKIGSIPGGSVIRSSNCPLNLAEQTNVALQTIGT